MFDSNSKKSVGNMKLSKLVKDLNRDDAYPGIMHSKANSTVYDHNTNEKYSVSGNANTVRSGPSDHLSRIQHMYRVAKDKFKIRS